MVTFFVLFLNSSMTLVLVASLTYHYYKRLSQNKLLKTFVFNLHAWIKASQGAGRRQPTKDKDDLEFELEMDDFAFAEDKCVYPFPIVMYPLYFILSRATGKK